MRFWRVTGLRPAARGILVGLVLLAASALVPPELHAESEAANPASATSTVLPLNIWYRSSDGCPDGSAFVARLAELGRRATLARVGDRVDFVVTVASASSHSSGRLEQQTARGTVAIRQLEAPGCDEVTEALALSLEIALDPDTESPATASVVPARGVMAGGANASTSPDSPVAGAARPASDASVERRERRDGGLGRELAIGAQASLSKGIAPGWAPGGFAFVELRATQGLDLAGRLSLGAAVAADSISGIDVDVLWLAGRAEVCASGLRSGGLSLQPCVGAELGRLRAGGSGELAHTAAGVWGAGLGHVRASLALDERVVLEAQLGASVPLVRYRVGSSLGGTLYQTEPLGIGLALGARWSP